MWFVAKPLRLTWSWHLVIGRIVRVEEHLDKISNINLMIEWNQMSMDWIVILIKSQIAKLYMETNLSSNC